MQVFWNHQFILISPGAEIIQDLDYDPSRRKWTADRLLRDAVHPGGGPLVHNGSEEQQRSFDSTRRKLHRFLTQAHPYSRLLTHNRSDAKKFEIFCPQNAL